MVISKIDTIKGVRYLSNLMTQYKRLPFLLIIFSVFSILYFVSSAAALHDDQIHDTPDVPFLDPGYVLPPGAEEQCNDPNIPPFALPQMGLSEELCDWIAKGKPINSQAIVKSAAAAQQQAEQRLEKAKATFSDAKLEVANAQATLEAATAAQGVAAQTAAEMAEMRGKNDIIRNT